MVESTVDVWGSDDIHFDEIEGVFNSDRIHNGKSISILFYEEVHKNKTRTQRSEILFYCRLVIIYI
jgi:hypothetical protein